MNRLFNEELNEILNSYKLDSEDNKDCLLNLGIFPQFLKKKILRKFIICVIYALNFQK